MIFRLTSLMIKAKSFLFFICFVVCQLSFAQTNNVIDSLMNVLKTAVEDTNKVNTLNILSRRLAQASKYSEGEKHATEALTLAEKLNFRRGMIGAYNNIASVYTAQVNYSEALKNHRASLKIKQEIGDKNGMAVTYNIIAQLYDFQGNYSESLNNLFASLKIREEIGDKRGMAGMYQNIGSVYSSRSRYSEAFKNYLAGLKIGEEIGDKKLMASSYTAIGNIYSSQGNQAEALSYYQMGLKMREELKDKRAIANSQILIGNLHKEMEKYEEALKCYFDAIRLFEELNDKPSTINIYFNIGFLYGSRGDFSSSLKYHEAALKISEETANKSGVAASYGNIGEVYYCQGLVEPNPQQREQLFNKSLNNYFNCLDGFKKTDNEQSVTSSYNNIGEVYFELKDYSRAKQFFHDALALAEKIRSIEDIKKNHWCMARLDSVTGDYQQALVHYKQYMDYKDSSLSAANSKQVAQMKEQYESEKKDKEILQLTSDKQKLESEKQIGALLLKAKQDSFSIIRAENDKVQLENEKVKALNLYNQNQIALLANEKKIQQLQIEKDKANYAVQKAEADKKQEQVTVLNKEKSIQDLDLKKQKQAKNYFIAGLALFAILSFFVYRNYRTRQKLKMQTLRNKIASDLHDDVGSTLSSISIFSQMAQQQSKETIPMLETIGESSRKMLDAMADIVWTINPENDQFEKIILRMKSFAYELLGAKKIGFEFIADDDVANMKIPMDVRKNLYLIFKEATNNLVKYSAANKALFAIKEEKNNLTMTIQDNGKGFDVKKPSGGNGLKNMKKRAIEIGAKLLIESHPGNGTTIQLKVAYNV